MPADVIETIRLRWLVERDQYVQFCKVLDTELKATLRKIGISATVTSRAKEIDSLIRKVLKQQKEGRHPTYESIIDKVGLRAIVRFVEEVDEAVNALQTTFNCLKTEYKTEVKEEQASDAEYRESLKKFGYRSCHMDITLLENHESYSRYPDFRAELQVRTLAQDLWAVMAHELSYKSILRDVAPARQDSIDRRIYILSALVESADMEFSRMNTEIMATPGAETFLLLRALEREYFKYASRPYDRELSLQTLKALAAVNPRPVNQAQDELSAFSKRYATRLSHIFSDQANNPDRSAFLFQPESIFIFECLATRQLSLEEEWEKSYPASELQRLASVWGIPVFD